jgi:uncharacterized protein (DUF58 family)
VTLTGRAVGALVLAALSGILIPWQAAALVMAVVVTVAVVDAWIVRSLPIVDRDFSPILSRGVPSSMTTVAGGRWPRIELYQAAGPDLTVDPQAGVRRIDTAITAHRRGSHPLVKVATRTVGPLGLGGWHHRAGTEDTVTVYPDMPAARRIATSVRLGHFREDGRRTRGPLGLGTEFESVREYRPDDDIRQLNWSASARTGVPMSNQFRVEQDRDVICVLDTGRLMASRVGDRTRLDVTVDAVAALAAVADQVGDRVGVVAFSRGVRRNLSPRRDGAGPVVHAIHDLEPLDEDSDFDLAFRTVLGRKRAFVLILTDLVDEAAARPLLDALPVLARKHAVAVASVEDPDLTEAMITPARDRGDMMATVAAIQLVAAKERVIAELGHRGVDVIEAPIEDFSARCVGAYLRAKNRARL